MSHLERLCLIDAAIRSNRYPSIASLAGEHEVTERTIKADIRYLKQRVHAPLKHDRKRGGYHYTDTSFVLPRLILTEHEAKAVRRALRAAREFGGVSGDAEALALLMARIGDIPPMGEGGPTVVGGSHLIPEAMVSEPLLGALEHAVARRRRVDLRYDGAHRGEITERTLQPWHLFLVEGEWYVTGFCERSQAQRDFHLSRVLEWRLQAEEGSYRIPPDFDGDAYVRSAFGVRHGEPLVMVRIRFTPYQARWIRERRYHPTQQLEAQPDGSVILTMTVAGTWEVRRWVLSFGAEAEVLEPTSLCVELAEVAKNLQKIYASTPEGSPDALTPPMLENQ
jgi:predicted DNA-binding transcriptional regulator YafY